MREEKKISEKQEKKVSKTIISNLLFEQLKFPMNTIQQ
jgi:hypothetical protein